MIRTTHTFVELEISESAYREIRDKLLDAQYFHCFETREENESGPIDMQGIAVVPVKNEKGAAEILEAALLAVMRTSAMPQNDIRKTEAQVAAVKAINKIRGRPEGAFVCFDPEATT